MPKRGLHLIKFPEKESKVKLPVEPIQEWIEQQAAQGMSLERLSTESGVDERQITRMRNGEQNWVSLYHVEKLIRLSDTLLEDIYPDIDSYLFSETRLDTAA